MYSTDLIRGLVTHNKFSDELFKQMVDVFTEVSICTVSGLTKVLDACNSYPHKEQKTVLKVAGAEGLFCTIVALLLKDGLTKDQILKVLEGTIDEALKNDH